MTFENSYSPSQHSPKIFFLDVFKQIPTIKNAITYKNAIEWKNL